MWDKPAGERYGNDAVLVVFTTYDGTVTAASDWDEAPSAYRIRPALDGSVEALLHDALAGAGLIQIRGRPETTGAARGAGWSGRSGSSTAPRPSAAATISRPIWRRSSTRWSTSTTRRR